MLKFGFLTFLHLYSKINRNWKNDLKLSFPHLRFWNVFRVYLMPESKFEIPKGIKRVQNKKLKTNKKRTKNEQITNKNRTKNEQKAIKKRTNNKQK